MYLLQNISLEASHAETSLYVRHGHEHPLSVLLYVDDLVITSADLTDVNRIKAKLSNIFEMKDQGNLHYFLDIEVIHTPSQLLLT